MNCSTRWLRPRRHAIARLKRRKRGPGTRNDFKLQSQTEVAPTILQQTNHDDSTWPDILVLKDFLDQSLQQQILSEMSVAEARASVVYGGGAAGIVDEATRRSLRLTPSSQTREMVVDRLRASMASIAKHFEARLSECEEPQFLRYQEGDFFVAHQDGNTGLLRLDTERRLVSTVIFLSHETDSPEPGPNVHCGGSLVFINLRARSEDAKVRIVARPGTLIAFRSETTHEVTPVTYGERHSIVSWYC